MTIANDLLARMAAVSKLEGDVALWRGAQFHARAAERRVKDTAQEARRAGVLMRDIVAITGISRSTLYAFFAEQEDEGA